MRNFNEMYEKIFKEYNQYLEKLRVKTYIYTIIFGAFLVLVYYYSFKDFPSKYKYFLIVSIFIICFCFYKILLKGKNTRIFKNGVINYLVKEYDPGLNYNPNGAISKITYDLGSFGQNYNIIKSEDTIKGTIKEGINLQLGEIELYNETINEKLGTRDKTKVFQGIFAKIMLNTDCFLSKIKIRNNRLVNFSSEKNKKVELESIEFEKHFDFYADNKIEALQLFTTDVIDKINYFREKYNVDFEMTLYKNEIYIRFQNKNSFEIVIGKNTLDYNMLYEYYKIIEMIGNIGIYFNDIIEKMNI